MWTWQHPDWPNFRYDPAAFQPQVDTFRLKSERLMGRVEALPADLQSDAVIGLMLSEAIKTSAIEGESLDRDTVRASLLQLIAKDTDVALGSIENVHFECVHYQEMDMPRTIVENNSRLALRVRPDDKAILMRAVAIEHTHMTDFILRHALEAARQVIDRAERQPLSERDSLRVLDALENPPAPNAKLLMAGRRLPKTP